MAPITLPDWPKPTKPWHIRSQARLPKAPEADSADAEATQPAARPFVRPRAMSLPSKFVPAVPEAPEPKSLRQRTLAGLLQAGYALLNAGGSALGAVAGWLLRGVDASAAAGARAGHALSAALGSVHAGLRDKTLQARNFTGDVLLMAAWAIKPCACNLCQRIVREERFGETLPEYADTNEADRADRAEQTT